MSSQKTLAFMLLSLGSMYSLLRIHPMTNSHRCSASEYKTAKKAGGSFALWGIGALLICCGGPIVLLALLSGGAAGVLGFFSSNVFLILVGALVFCLAIIWFVTKVRIKK